MRVAIASSAAAAVIASLAVWQIQDWRWSERWARAEQAQAKTVAQAQQQAREKEQSMQKEVERIANESLQREGKLAGQAAAAERVARGLRDEITRLNARSTPADPGSAAFAHEASVARELLGSCAAEYQAVAREADVIRNQLTGLQNYVTSVLKSQ